MAGGLLQLVSYGVQNRYLTKNPEITFFKIAYKRHTHFGKENVVLNYDQEPEFDKKISFTIPNNGDLLSNLTLHFNLENFIPNLSSLSNNVLILLNTKINNLKEELSFLKSTRDNLKIYNNIIFGAIKIIEKYQNTLNISLPLISNLISSYQKKIINDFNGIKDLIDTNILENSNIFKLLLEDNFFSTIDELISSSKIIKEYLIKKINILNNRIIEKNNSIVKYENYPITYKWKKNLINLLVSEVEFEIDGELIDRLTRDDIELYFQHHYRTDEKNKFEKINNGKEYFDFDLYLPLNFWFKESYGLGIPIIALQYSTIKINVLINKLENLLDFFIIEDEYEKLLKLEYEYENITYQVNNGLVEIDNVLFDIKKISFNSKTEILTLKSEFIYQTNLINNLEIDSSEAENILNSYGSIKNDGELSLDLIEYKNFINDLPNFNKEILPIQYNINRFNLTSTYQLNLGDLYCEYIYLDQIEREKFASSRLNYVIKTHFINNFNIVDLYFNKNLEIENYVTDMFWYLQEKKELEGSTLLSPNYYNLVKNTNIENFQLKLNSYDLFHKKNSPDYFNYVQPYQYLHNNLNDNYFYYSFALFPEENQPSGGLSLSDIGGKQFQIQLKNISLSETEPIILKILYKKVSILTIAHGKGKLAFYNKS